MPTFDLLVVGAGGGPNENNLSGYLLKASDGSWTEDVVGLEAGSGLGALTRILERNPGLLSRSGDTKSPPLDATQIYTNLSTYLITHPHLDHVLSLILLAGRSVGPRKSIRAARQCLLGLETVFKPGRVWPDLASWKRGDPIELYFYDPLPDEAGVYTALNSDLSVSMYPLSHGPDTVSSAFFIRHDENRREFLFFGDAEPDKLAWNGKDWNAHIWQVAAPKIVTNRLDTIFIECSWPVGRSNRMLFGHLTPEHLVSELEVLAEAVVRCRDAGGDGRGGGGDPGAMTLTKSTRKRDSSTGPPERKRLRQEEEPTVQSAPSGALSGVSIYIMHCKEDLEGKYPGRPIHAVISEQVRNLVEEKELGATIVAVEQGQLIHI